MDGADTELMAAHDIAGDDVQREFNWNSDGKPHWIRIDVRDQRGRLLLMGNPVYLNR
jgi:hypothetical protein